MAQRGIRSGWAESAPGRAGANPHDNLERLRAAAEHLDPDTNGPAVLYVYKIVRHAKAPGGAEFVPALVHNASGAGSTILAADLNKDGVMDIVTSTKLGLFVFWGKRQR